MAVLDPTDLYMRSRGDDWVYFSEDTHPTSYSGCVDDASAISEQEIAEFVRYANPGLFEKLKGVRFASTHLHPEQDAKPTDAVATYQHQVLETDSRGRRLLFQGDSIKTACTEESESSVEEAGLPLSIGSGDGEELGRAEQSFMLDERYLFTLHAHTDPNATYQCSQPTCQHTKHIIPLGDIFASMRDEAWSENSVLLNDDPATVYLCHDCLQEVLVEQIEEEKVHEMLPRLVDGSCDRQSILKSAEKMHPCLTPKQSFFTYLPEGPTLEPGEGSNSVKGLRRRRQKQYEIDKILRRLRYDQRVRMLRLKGRREVKASDLKTQTPFDIDPYRERYKKQGLEWNDRSGQGEERKASKTSSMHEKVAKGAVDHSLGGEDAFTCYCRESNDGEALIQCSSGSCMFGWIHFRCSGLNEMPDTSESHYVCQHCTGDYPMLTRSRRDPMSLMVKHGDDGPQTDPWDSDCYVASLSEDEDSSTNGGEPGDETEESQREANPFEWIAVNTPKSLPMR